MRSVHQSNLTASLQSKIINFGRAGRFNSPGYMTFRGSDEILRILENSGHLMKRLQFNGDAFAPEERSNISESIVKYCASTLLEIILNDPGDYLIQDSEVIFPQVNNMTLLRVGSANIQLQINRIYPTLKWLKLIIDRYIPPPLSQQYPSLQYLQLVEDSKVINVNLVRNIIQNTPELLELHLNRLPTPHLIEFIRKALPRLHSLSFKFEANAFEAFNTRPLHFKNLENLSLNLTGSNITAAYEALPFTFDRLEVLQLLDYTGSSAIPFKLIERNTGLILLSMPFVNDIERFLQMLRVIKEFRELKEILLTWSRLIDPDYTIRAMSEFCSSKKYTFVVSNFKPDVEYDRNILITIIPDQWNIDERIDDDLLSATYHITATRKSN